MYPDPKRVRVNRLMVRFDDYEYALITALANYQGECAATLIREMVLREAAEALIPASNVAHEHG
ncbi:hypothetical protein LFL97_19650 [Burkholderia sp. JSH-S8]|nr:hypothetical protein LFL97_19650 [Burkholderia sp. JSH-S8]